ncbi:MAG TPA: CaiB/BaiF CoA-transferase family protein [Candidatus Xenobia bacterium]|jgi:crotonobetainyl-CoA:carnitine CoA-transferase CaiB-like acyl-CoA transferase
MRRPLEGIRVLDLSRVLAGPFCSMLMSDMGADIVKIEEPGQGDDTRRFGPPFINGQSAYFLSVNRNKRSLAMDMKAPEAKAVLRTLVERSDVLLENFRPGTAARLGLGWEEVHAINPRLVYCSVSGYGQTGPESKRPGYDVVIQGTGGIMSLTGDPDGPPYKMGISQADLVAGMNAFSGILLALRTRDRDGVGQRVDVSLLDCQVSLLTFQAQNYFTTGKSPHRMGNQHPSIAPYETVRTADGYLNIAVGNDKLWQGFCAATGRQDLASDARFSTNPLRVANREALMEALAPLFKQHELAWWMSVLDKAGIPAGPILEVDEVLTHPQVLARDMVVEVEHPTLGPLKLVNNPLKLSDTPPRVTSAPPLLGQHSREVLRELGVSDHDIEAWCLRGVVASP